MYYNVVGNDYKYKGIERHFSPTDYYQKHKMSNREFKQLVEYELEAIDLGFNMPQNKENFEKICAFCKIMKAKGFDCDVIVYDDKPIKQAYGRSLLFLGIDIEANGTECPLSFGNKEGLTAELNKNGLCPNIEIAQNISEFWRTEFNHFSYYYVYQVRSY